MITLTYTKVFCSGPLEDLKATCSISVPDIKHLQQFVDKLIRITIDNRAYDLITGDEYYIENIIP